MCGEVSSDNQTTYLWVGEELHEATLERENEQSGFQLIDFRLLRYDSWASQREPEASLNFTQFLLNVYSFFCSPWYTQREGTMGRRRRSESKTGKPIKHRPTHVRGLQWYHVGITDLEHVLLDFSKLGNVG